MLKPTWSATETSWNVEFRIVANLTFELSKERLTNADDEGSTIAPVLTLFVIQNRALNETFL